MKKFVFMLIAMFSVVMLIAMFSVVVTFDSEPIEPKIIGTGNLQYEAKTDTWFVVIDSTQYTITSVNCAQAIGYINPVEGILVTVFTSHSMEGLQAITGEQSVKQIEEVYQINNICVLIQMLGLFAFGIVLLFAIFVTAKS